ncbi:MAG: acylneuraminate cytidylyltransferase family protein [Gammaproteobacteria bacterium]|nr:acylneuraminate cytidylyltransferase family protein [Gammaproteobacteria bacterium]MBU0788290.1 acylneuraminate cytidylyltransferase family protein [Gammaproteobacteria bacterium]MBU0815213.1 acylneuraminate cytidylyltransferase family protein [Gammaproteobacteria bacterium]MBU1785679.1 acylneuraminate cytidylyltransferase family protein [Gammaproteobacteria bacterium]
MIGGKKVLAVIPARGGSKGLPGKNIRELAGKPLIVWTIEAAQASGWIDRLILSSDDDEIIQVARRWGCEVPFVRAGHLATDEATTVDVVLDALQRCPGYDWVVVLQPTSPLRSAEDIDNCLSECIGQGASVGVSVCEASASPYWMFGRDERGQLQNLLPMPEGVTRRQDLPKAYQLNGAVYVAECGWLQVNACFITSQTHAYVMPQQRSIDIDVPIDFLLAQQLLSVCV